MATLISKATGNFTSSSTWALVDSTSLQSNSGVSATPGTTYASSGTFTPGAITVDGVAIYIGSRTGSTGTLSVAITQSNVAVSGAEVTINVSDLPNIATYVSPAGIGWVFFKFAAPVTLIAATVYAVGIKTSSASQVTVRVSVSTNYTRMLRTTTTQAPAAADTLNILGEWTTAGTVSAITVTMNETATTAYGQLNIGNNGTLAYGVSSSTNYYLKTLDVFVQALGTLKIGTSASPIPSSSSAVLEFASTGSGTYGLWILSLGTFESYGASKTGSTSLSANAAAAATSFTVVDTTGWVAGDEVAFGPTNRTVAEYEKKTLLTVPTSTTFTTAATTYAHTGTGTFAGQSLAGEVVNLSRNVKIRGLNATTTTAFVQIWDTATFSSTYTEFYFFGSFTVNKDGISIQTTTGSASFVNCSSHDHYLSSSYCFNIASASSNNITINSSVAYNAVTGLIFTASSNTNIVFTNNTIIGMSTVGALLQGLNLTFTGNIFSGCNAAVRFDTVSGVSTGTINTNKIHSCSNGFYMQCSSLSILLGSASIWFCTNAGIIFVTNFQTDSLIFDSFNLFGNFTQNILVSANIAGPITFKNLTSNSNSTLSTTSGILFGASVTVTNLSINDSVFGSTVAHTQDISFSTTPFINLSLNNVLLASSIEVTNQTNFILGSQISSQKHDQTAGNYKSWKKYGTITVDSVIYDVTSPSMRITPNNASGKIQGGSFKVAVASGTTISPSIRVRKSVSGDGATYNGNQPRLVLLANIAAGVASDTVIATASSAANGAWETISGTSPSVTDNAILEFVVDCDGTAGWVNVDNFDATGASTLDLAYWSRGEAQALVSTSSGGGGSSVAYMAY